MVKTKRRLKDTPAEDLTRKLLGSGEAIRCGQDVDAKCCYTPEFANRECKRLYGKDHGYSNVFAVPIPTTDERYPKFGCSKGGAYECRADATPVCPRPGYNRDGKYGTMLNLAFPGPPGSPTFMDLDSSCRASFGPNSIRDFGDLNALGQCVIADWKKQQLYPGNGFKGPTFGIIKDPRGPDDLIAYPPNENPFLQDCCNKAKNADPKLAQVCDPHTCFGKPACDNVPITQQICSDSSNIATDPACVDTCIRNNSQGRLSWCNMPIQNFCQGKNLETEACRQYCSAANLDQNESLAAFCDNAYTNYCASKDPAHDAARKKVLCGCINSPLALAPCVDANCTNSQAIRLSQQRKIDVKDCPNICTQNFIVDGQPIIDIDHLKWEQYCPGYPLPGSNPDNPFRPSDKEDKSLKLAWYIGAPVLLVLFILALVFVFQTA